MTGVALVLQDTRGASGLGIDPTKSVWFCSCTAANSNIWSQIQALHSAPGGCASLEDADCSHVRYLKHLFQNQSFTIEEIVMESPVYEDQDLAGCCYCSLLFIFFLMYLFHYDCFSSFLLMSFFSFTCVYFLIFARLFFDLICALCVIGFLTFTFRILLAHLILTQNFKYQTILFKALVHR